MSQTLAQQFDAKAMSALQGLDLKARYIMEGFLSGVHRSPFHGHSVEFSDYRKYQPGDDLRRIDWKLFGRTDRLCVKRFIVDTNARFYLVCDNSASMRYRGAHAWESKMGCARIVAAALTWFLLSQNDAAGLIACGPAPGTPRFVRPSQRPTQFGLMLRELEALQPAGSACLAQLLQHTARLAHRRSMILVFSDLLEPSADVELCFKQLRFQGHECMVFQVLDGDEITFPFTEAKLFEDLETGLRRQVTPALVREKYLERFNAFMDAHRRLFRGLEIPHCVLRNDESPWDALAKFIAERGRRK